MNIDIGFTSWPFFVFFAILLIAYWVTPKKYRWIELLIASIAFYAFFSWKFYAFIVFTTVVIYLTARYLTSVNQKQKLYFEQNPDITPEQKKEIIKKNKRKKKAMLLLGILSNIAVLVCMKYLNFIILNINDIIGWFTDAIAISPINLFLPLGISFYTFQAIAYLVDVYWGKHEAEKNFFKFTLFITFFPKIMQGPIIRYKEMEQELFGEHSFDFGQFTDGLKRIAWGLFKKMVIADCLVVFVNFAFGDVSAISGMESFLAILFYLIQDYCDFSGYMDIAIGICMCLGIKLPENFKRPYFARTIDDYWRRWHITLGTWFKDYIFYPISISKFSLKLGKFSKKLFKSFGKIVPAVFGLLVVWFATGLWHGASWNYVLWGLYYGVIIILGIVFEPLIKKIHKRLHINVNTVFYKILQHIRTIIILAVGRVIFITTNLGDAFAAMGKWFTMFSDSSNTNIVNQLGIPSIIIACTAFAVVLVVDLIQECRPQTSFCDKVSKLHIAIRWTLYIILIVAIIWFGFYGSGLPRFEFGYVQF